MEHPDAIAIFSAGVKKTPTGAYVPTDYGDRDAFGVLGGMDRVEAGALLAAKYPNALLVTTSRALGRTTESLAKVYAHALCALGVEQERVIKEEVSSNTRSAVGAVLHLARVRKWKYLTFLSSEFHLPRIKAFYDLSGTKVSVDFVSSESLLIERDPEFKKKFFSIKQTPAYQERLAVEERGIKALKSGGYTEAPEEDKLERGV